MDDEPVSNRPESPKKKVKSNHASDSEAQPSSNSDYPDNNGMNYVHANGDCPTRDGRSFIPDSSSERMDENQNRPAPRIQEEEVSSSENSVSKGKKKQESVSEDNADSEAEPSILICDSVSSEPASSDLNDKH